VNKELEHVINAVRAAVIYDYPYDYCYITNFFSNSFYDELLKNLPAPGEYDYYRRKRYRFKMKQSDNEVIREAVKILTSKKLQNAYFTKFKKALIKGERDKTEVVCEPTFMKDTQGYYISPHRDHGLKVLTTQIYLPEDNTHENSGTIMNIKEGEQFINYKQFKFHRNTSYAFVRSANSWHSVDTLTEDNFDRNSIMFIYYKYPEK